MFFFLSVAHQARGVIGHYAKSPGYFKTENTTSQTKTTTNLPTKSTDGTRTVGMVVALQKQSQNSLHPNGPRQRRKLFTAALKLLWFFFELMPCALEAQTVIKTYCL